MKVNQGAQPSQLFEQMRKAHTDRKQEISGADKASGFSLQNTGAASGAGTAGVQGATGAQATQTTGLQKSILQIAQKVLDGKHAEPVAARREVIEAIVDDRFGGMIDPSKRRQTVSMLEYTLSEDPHFAKEVDQMLIFAARELATSGQSS